MEDKVGKERKDSIDIVILNIFSQNNTSIPNPLAVCPIYSLSAFLLLEENTGDGHCGRIIIIPNHITLHDTCNYVYTYCAVF